MPAVYERMNEDEELKNGDVYVALCTDGMVHAFRVLDDGPMERPACGSPARETEEASGQDFVCDACIMAMAKNLGCHEEYVTAAVRAVRAERHKQECASSPEVGSFKALFEDATRSRLQSRAECSYDGVYWVDCDCGGAIHPRTRSKSR
jgi:hypothetical protein